MAFNASTGQLAGSRHTETPLAVKHTFLDLPEDSAWTRFTVLRKSKTMPAAPEDLGEGCEGYTPGAFSDSVTSTCFEELLESRRVDNRKDASRSQATSFGSDLPTFRSRSPGSSTSTASRSSSLERIMPREPTQLQDSPPGPAWQALTAPEAQQAAALPAEKAWTTLVLRNVPLNYTRAMLLKMLDKEGFAGLYDFVYLPRDFHRHAGLGYAFINLVDASFVPRFQQTFEGFRRWAIPTGKVGAVGWSSPLQGLEAYVKKYRNSPVMHPNVPDEFRPLLFANGQRVPFPHPTKPIKSPMRKLR